MKHIPAVCYSIIWYVLEIYNIIYVYSRIQRHFEMTSNSSTGPGFLYLQLSVPRSKVSVDVSYLISRLPYIWNFSHFHSCSPLACLLLYYGNFSALSQYLFFLPLLNFPCCCMRKTKSFISKPEGKRPFKGRMWRNVLSQILRKQNVTPWTEFIWLKIWACGGLC